MKRVKAHCHMEAAEGISFPNLPDSSRPCRLMKRQGRLLLGRLLEKLFYEACRILFARCKSFKLIDPGSGHKIGGQEISFCGSRSDDEVC